MKTFTNKSGHVLALFIIFISAFVLYVNTLGNKYCLDDAIVITQNQFTKQGLSGIRDIFTTESFTGFFGKQKDLVTGSRYRPLSIASFAVEYEIFKKPSPAFSHLVNIVLYGFTGILIFFLLLNIITNPDLKYVPFLTSLIFIFHPVHTEVVANIKGRDEIMALFFSLSGCLLVIRYLKTSRIFWLFVASFLWLLGLFSKENAIIFWVIMPIIIYMTGVMDTKRYFLPVLFFSISAIGFLVIRHAVIGNATAISGELMNDSFAGASINLKYPTLLSVLWKYVALLFLPLTLTYDYYPYHIRLLGWENPEAILGLVVYAVLIISWVLSVRKNKLVFLSLSFYLLALLPVSNIFFPIGTFMSERFIYFSSLGFCILIASGLLKLAGMKFLKGPIFIIITIMFIFFTVKTITRNKDWYDDYKLFLTDVKTSGNSAKSNCSAGGVLLESLDTISNPVRRNLVMNQSLNYLKKSVSIHPAYADALLLLGNVYFVKGNADSAQYFYGSILDRNPEHHLAFTNMQALVNSQKDPDQKIALLLKMLRYKPLDYSINYQLGSLYGKEKKDLKRCIEYLNKAVNINPGTKDAWVDLGVAYGLQKDFKNSARVLKRASELDPNDPNIFINLGITLQNLRQTQKAAECFERAKELQKVNMM